jgi:hypothetical protein
MLHQRAWHVVITKYRFRKVSQQVWIADGKGHTEGRESVLQGGKRSTDFEITASSKSSAKCRKQWMKGHIAYFWIRKVSCRCRTLYLGRAHSSNRGITASGRFWGGVDCGGRSTKRARVVEPMNTRRAVTAWGSVENGTCRRAHGTNGKGVRTCTAVSNAVRIPRCGRFVDCCGLWE